MSQSQSSGDNMTQFELPDTVLSRRPIFNSQQNVFAYELQLDSRLEAVGNEREEAMTAELLLHLVDDGIETFVDNLTAFIPISKSYVRAKLPIIDNVKNVVFEIPEGLLNDEEKQRFFKSINNEDISFAWIHPTPGSLDGDLLNRVEYVKLDVTSHTPAQISTLIKYYKTHGIKIIADQISNPIMFDHCVDQGFDLFMGYFFCMPKIIDHKKVPANRISVLQLICELQNPNTTIDRIQEIVEKDVSLSYRVLRYINSANFHFPKKIESIKHAILIAGLDTIKTLSVIVAHAKIVDKPPELFKIALMRARMGETLAHQFGLQTDVMFLLGLFTTLDALTDSRMDDITKRLPLSDEIRYILVNYMDEVADPNSKLLNALVSFEKGDWDRFDISGFDIHVMREHYWKAANWVAKVLEVLSGPQITQVN